MDFRLSDEQLQIQQMVRDFAVSEIKPHLAEWDEAQHFPVDTFKRAGELGMLGIRVEHLENDLEELKQGRP